ncbi:hypothetical protein [Streptomyces olivaceus]|uniref:hypothetical protein n=1 Tax=Streptomyces olivaceus TaxID=47716 RepID=UPI001CCE2BF2|nr:hypothetical protein [Streptomyces olivaceus]
MPEKREFSWTRRTFEMRISSASIWTAMLADVQVYLDPMLKLVDLCAVRTRRYASSI